MCCPDNALMLGRRRRQWASIRSALGQLIVYAIGTAHNLVTDMTKNWWNDLRKLSSTNTRQNLEFTNFHFFSNAIIIIILRDS